jgi:hypothetical protein
MNIKSYSQFINEAKLYIYHTTFKVYDLLESSLYKKSKIKKWMRMYDFDKYAHCVFVSESKPPVDRDKFIHMPKAALRIKNVSFFDSDIKKHQGYMPEDSKIMTTDGQEVYLYIFKKNSNEANRARQLHGFIYEGDIRRYNGLQRFGKTHKWDAEGGMDKTYLKWRADSGKNIELWDKSKYHSLLEKDPVSGIDEVIWSPKENDVKFDYYPDNFSEPRNWSIKCMKIGTDVEMGDFKRISGLEIEGGKLTIKETTAEYFILAVGFHDGIDKKNIVEEYLILMPVKVWESYLPDIWTKKSDFEQMYNELTSHRLKGEGTDEQEEAWLQFRIKYRKLAESSTIKLRFKRDSKGQLRIQSAISYNDFKTKILQNPHIKIS